MFFVVHLAIGQARFDRGLQRSPSWVAVKELNLSYHFGYI